MTARRPTSKNTRQPARCRAHGVVVGTVERVPFGAMVHGPERCPIRWDSDNADREGLARGKRHSLRIVPPQDKHK